MGKTVSLTNEELDFIKKGTAEFAKLKMALGEIELQKQNILRQADEIMVAFGNNEKYLIDKYGSDAVINMQTGEVTKKEADINELIKN